MVIFDFFDSIGKICERASEIANDGDVESASASASFFCETVWRPNKISDDRKS